MIHTDTRHLFELGFHLYFMSAISHTCCYNEKCQCNITRTRSNVGSKKKKFKNYFLKKTPVDKRVTDHVLHAPEKVDFNGLNDEVGSEKDKYSTWNRQSAKSEKPSRHPLASVI